MGKITAKIKFITPLLIGGASNKLDENGLLRAASLRGVLRFWFRAIAGPIIGLSKEDVLKKLHKSEDELFGSTEKAVLKVRIFPEDKPVDTSWYFLLPHKEDNKRARVPGIKEGAVFRIEIWERKLDNKLDNKLVLPTIASVLWLWGSLGAIGKRARRGFGSPVITELNININGSPLTGLPTIPSFANPKELKEYLSTGLDLVNKTIAKWLNSSPLVLNQSEPSKAPYFVICSKKQIHVGAVINNTNFDDKYGPIGILVKNTTKDPAFGSGKPRHASPVFIRYHHVASNKFVPVATWCKQEMQGKNDACVEEFLKKLGFSCIV